MIRINEGTQTPLQADVVGTINYPTFKLDVGAAGASALFANTLGTVQNLNQGTITALAKGTISVGTFAMTTGTLAAGTIFVGTMDSVSQLPPNSFGTTVSTGTNVLGTIKAAISGSQIFVTDLIVSVGSASNVEIASGGTSTPIVGTMYFNANGGIISNFRVPIATVAGSALVFKQSSAISPLTITAQGFVR